MKAPSIMLVLKNNRTFCFCFCFCLPVNFLLLLYYQVLRSPVRAYMTSFSPLHLLYTQFHWQLRTICNLGDSIRPQRIRKKNLSKQDLIVNFKKYMYQSVSGMVVPICDFHVKQFVKYASEDYSFSQISFIYDTSYEAIYYISWTY